ncbi:LysR family transcriptional regulator [Kribbella antibiotica]|uniref:LysR family transcriptional regulator n=1 Tax=Kribbella antibiotica TaxID=190195 RepID=A0A4R4YPY0_9ACTN|nr:LysR substrate-binding domain-containing protein [Kribbella antibiotica]TDD46199.1 LysR family transcriptional regulator [Kribbella antibiotica]
MTDSSFRLGYVPGVTPAKWARIWAERLPRTPIELIQVAAADAVGLVHSAGADAALVRLPIDKAGLHAIPLYVEQTVVVVPKDHVVSAVEEVTLDDLADELMLNPQDDVLMWERPLPGRVIDERPASTADAIALVAMGTGLLVVPMSLARLHHRKDLTFRPITDAPSSQVALTWPEDAESGLMEEFVGIVRGRTANSTRGSKPAPEPKKAAAAKKQAPKKQIRPNKVKGKPGQPTPKRKYKR